MANSKFVPVRGKQESIDIQPLRDGYVYYAYDTGHMYMDKIVNGTVQRFPVGSGASGIVYASGNENTIKKVSPDDTDFNYDIIIIGDEVDGNTRKTKCFIQRCNFKL